MARIHLYAFVAENLCFFGIKSKVSVHFFGIAHFSLIVFFFKEFILNMMQRAL